MSKDTSFEDELDQDFEADAAAERDHIICPVIINGKMRRLKFTQMDGLEWADICDRNPPRVKAEVSKTAETAKLVDIDGAYGYNVLGAAVLAATTSGLIQSGEKWVALTPERWKRLMRGLPGAQLRSVATAIFQLNQWDPALAVTEAKKAFEVESALKLYSPAPSESPAAD